MTKSSMSASSIELVASDDDLLEEILLRLPVKPLLRFKSVSKRWFSIIKSHRFYLRRYSRPNSAFGLFIEVTVQIDPTYIKRRDYITLLTDNSVPDPPHTDLEFSHDPFVTLLLQSCNGLFLCRTFKYGLMVNNESTFYVYNPATRQLAALADSGTEFRDGVTLAFDPFRSSHYKVVWVRPSNSLHSYPIEVYSSETRTWTVVGEIGRDMMVIPYPYKFRMDGLDCGAYWNGSVHWIFKWATKALKFNIDTHVLDEMPNPPCVQAGEPYSKRWDYFGASGDHLHYVKHFSYTRDDASTLWFNIYEMKMDYSEWFVKYRVDFSQIIGTYPCATILQNRCDICVLTIIQGKQDEDSIIFFHMPRKIIRYNVVDGSMRTLQELQDEVQYEADSSLLYIESLFGV